MIAERENITNRFVNHYLRKSGLYMKSKEGDWRYQLRMKNMFLKQQDCGTMKTHYRALLPLVPAIVPTGDSTWPNSSFTGRGEELLLDILGLSVFLK